MDTEALCELLGIQPRTLRSWIKAGLVPRPRFRGRATAYSEGVVLRAQAAAALRRENVPMALARRELDRASVERLRELAGVAAPEPAPVEAQAIAAPVPVEEPCLGVGWRRVALMDGLELHVRDDAGPIAMRVAADIARGRWPDQNVSERLAKPPLGAPASPKRKEGPKRGASK